MATDILLVDDNCIQATTRKAILARSGRSVALASDGRQALDFLRDSDAAHPVGLIVTDHLMPGMNGPEFVAQLRLSYPRLPVLVLSGLPDAEEEYCHLDVMFRVKPFPPDELLSLVHSVLHQMPIGRTA
ncbi:MAG TPA: response regulator [Acidobacteriaceae bacterium]|jgi:CheY-like chemotaxis protein|nr:response regulator [Acidobacteriaceae bacterium]